MLLLLVGLLGFGLRFLGRVSRVEKLVILELLKHFVFLFGKFILAA
jgi:hypothetical protein